MKVQRGSESESCKRARGAIDGDPPFGVRVAPAEKHSFRNAAFQLGIETSTPTTSRALEELSRVRSAYVHRGHPPVDRLNPADIRRARVMTLLSPRWRIKSGRWCRRLNGPAPSCRSAARFLRLD